MNLFARADLIKLNKAIEYVAHQNAVKVMKKDMKKNVMKKYHTLPELIQPKKEKLIPLKIKKFNPKSRHES